MSDQSLGGVQAQTKTENWCGVLQEVALPGTYGDPEAFLDAAVRFANEDCWGTLSCALMVQPSLLALYAGDPLGRHFSLQNQQLPCTHSVYSMTFAKLVL